MTAAELEAGYWRAYEESYRGARSHAAPRPMAAGSQASVTSRMRPAGRGSSRSGISLFARSAPARRCPCSRRFPASSAGVRPVDRRPAAGASPLRHPAGERRRLSNPARQQRLVEVVAFMNVEIAHVLVLGHARRKRAQ